MRATLILANSLPLGWIHASVPSRRDFSTALAARSAGLACGKVSAGMAIVPSQPGGTLIMPEGERHCDSPSGSAFLGCSGQNPFQNLMAEMKSKGWQQSSHSPSGLSYGLWPVINPRSQFCFFLRHHVRILFQVILHELAEIRLIFTGQLHSAPPSASSAFKPWRSRMDMAPSIKT